MRRDFIIPVKRERREMVGNVILVGYRRLFTYITYIINLYLFLVFLRPFISLSIEEAVATLPSAG